MENKSCEKTRKTNIKESQQDKFYSALHSKVRVTEKPTEVTKHD